MLTNVPHKESKVNKITEAIPTITTTTPVETTVSFFTGHVTLANSLIASVTNVFVRLPFLNIIKAISPSPTPIKSTGDTIQSTLNRHESNCITVTAICRKTSQTVTPATKKLKFTHF